MKLGGFLLRWFVFVIVFPLLVSSAFAYSGRANLTYSRGESFEEGEKISTSDRLSQNYFLGLSRVLTPMLSYRFSLSASLFDQTTESEGLTRNIFRRSGTAGLDFTLDNPYFRLTSGYVRRENWNTARLVDESRTSRDFYYARLDVVTRDFPTLYLEYDRSTTFDHLPVAKTDTTSTKYSASSSYHYKTEALSALYTLSYTRTETDTPLALVRQFVEDSYAGAYNVRYDEDFWDRSIDLAVAYRGNLGRTESTSTVGETGLVLFKRIPRVGLHARDVFVRDVRELQEEPDLTNLDYETPINTINIGTEEFHNIGIELDISEENKTVDRIFVYVFVPVGTILKDPPALADWSAFSSETNPPEPIGTDWDPVNVQEVILHPPSEVTDINPDVDNPSIYLYEIVFTSPQQGVRFYKVINEVPVSQTGLQDVFVTEIEAQGEELVTAGESTTVNDFFAQGIDLRLGLNRWKKVKIVLHYNIYRSDSNPTSFLNPVTGIFKNLFSKDLGVEEDTRVTVRRSFGPAVIWRTLDMLTTTFRINRSEFFDSDGLTDTAANTYLVSFDATPLPTLDAHLSAIRTDSFSFGTKRSTNHSLLMTLGTKLYSEVRMTTDVGYIDSKNHETGGRANSEFIRGTIDARITEALITHATFGLEWASTEKDSEKDSSSARNGTVIVTYRPARLINFSGNFRIRDTDDDTTTTEGVSVSWQPWPVIRILGSYQHKNVSPGPENIDSVTASVKWDVAKFLDVRVTATYTRALREVETESRGVTVNLNGRF
ncbi:MAG: hypothetical protein P8Y85_05275 [Nitrospirota bacterium]|jgi:hypothetical protein